MRRKQSKAPRVPAALLSLAILLTLIPFAGIPAQAQRVSKYFINLTEKGKIINTLDNAVVKLTDKSNDKYSNAQNSKSGVVEFSNFADEGATYILSVRNAENYEDVENYELKVNHNDTKADVELKPVQKAKITGTVLDENSTKLEKASVSCSYKVDGKDRSFSVETDKDGKFTLSVLPTGTYNVTVSGADRHEPHSFTVNNPTGDLSVGEIVLSVKKFHVQTDCGEHGAVTVQGADPENPHDVLYGGSAVIQADADSGYRVKELKINGETVQGAANRQSFTYTLENITSTPTVSATFDKKVYKIKLHVGRDGKVSYSDGTDSGDIECGEVEVSKDYEKTYDEVATAPVMHISATPHEGFRVASVTISENLDGEEKSDKFDFTENDRVYERDFTVDRDYTFSVSFLINTYKITVEDVDSGEAVYLLNSDGQKTLEDTANYGQSEKVCIDRRDKFISKIFINDADVTDSCVPVEEDGILVFTLSDIKSDMRVRIVFAEPAESGDAVSKLVTDDYTISFVDASGNNLPETAYYTQGEGTYILPRDAKVVIAAKDGFMIKASEDADGFSLGGFSLNSVTFTSTTVVKRIITVRQYKYDSHVTNVSFKFIIDKIAPKITELTSSDWTNANTVKISGKAEDPEPDSSQLDKAVLSRGVSLDEDEVRARAAGSEGVAAIADGSFVFDSEPGDQDSEYYVYVLDRAGNVSNEHAAQVQIDTAAPEVSSFAFSSSDKGSVTEEINFTGYGTFSSDTIYLTVSARDLGEIKSGVKSIVLFKDGEKLAEQAADESGAAIFALKKDDFMTGGKVSAQAVDLASNASNATAVSEKNPEYSDFVQVSDAAPTVTVTAAGEMHTDKRGKWFGGDAQFTVELNGGGTGLKSVKLRLNGKELTELNKTYCDAAAAVLADTVTVPVTKSGENKLEVVVENLSGKKAEAKDTKNTKLFIDRTSPAVTGFEITTVGKTAGEKLINFLSFGNFFKEQVRVTVTADDADGSGIKEIKLFAEPYSEASPEEFTAEVKDNKAEFLIPIEEITDEGVHFNAKLSAVARDFTGNNSSKCSADTVNSDIKNSGLMIENVMPSVTPDFPQPAKNPNPNTDTGNDWYSANIDIQFDVSDEDSGIGSAEISDGKNTFNTPAEVIASEDGKIKAEHFLLNTNDAAINPADGSYTFTFTATDNAGNVNNTFKKTIYKDVEAPSIVNFEFSAKDFKESDGTKTGTATPTEYGYYFTKDTVVTITAKDPSPGSGMRDILYYLVDKDSGKTEVKSVQTDKDGRISFTVSADFKGEIFACAVDNVGNSTGKFVTPSSAIVESPDRHSKETHIRFERDEAKHRTASGGDLYNAPVPVKVTVTDTFSGIRRVEWSVSSPIDGEITKGDLRLNNSGKPEQGAGDKWEVTKNERNLLTEMHKTITVSANRNDLVLKVKLTDRAGNTTEDEQRFSIDATAPSIKVTYDQNTGDSSYKDYYKVNRTATVVITERNFNAADVKYSLLRDGGNYAQLGDWTTAENASDPDKTTHTAKVAFTADGDYELDIEYTDRAGNRSADHPTDKFTIDKTAPVFSVSYDNSDVRNGMYYKADRVATITVTEHNFDSSRVNITGTASESAFPPISGWSDNGDTHVATISYSADSKYTFDVSVTDKAGNGGADYTPDTFVVDKTKPTLEIGGVKDKSANNGDVIPTVMYSDTNFDSNAVKIAMTGALNKEVDYKKSISAITNGQSVVYENFPKKKSIDDIYTLKVRLTDLAGNSTEQSIRFSVNRFGSTYDLSAVEEIQNKYISEEIDLIIREINVDTLDMGKLKITVTKSGTPIDLTEADYKVEHTGGDGEWSVYEYTIFKSVFADDAVYRLTLNSTDAAGNINENNDESKKAEITFSVDKTPPVVVPIDIEANTQYDTKLKVAKADITDNMKLDGVTIKLNGEKVRFDQDGETYTFNIPEAGERYNVSIVARDAAGNLSEQPEISGVLVSTNLIVRWFNNTPLFVGSLAGVVVLGLGIASFIVFGLKRRK